MKKQSRILLALLCLAFIGGFTACLPTPKTEFSVTYKVTGTALGANLTIGNESDGTEQFGVTIPWEKTFTAKRGLYLYVSAQNQYNFGSVTCEIWVDGVKCKESTSSGAYVISSCHGILN